MTEETSLVYDKWFELIEKIVEVYMLAKKAKYMAYKEQDNDACRHLAVLCQKCSEMLAVIEK